MFFATISLCGGNTLLPDENENSQAQRQGKLDVQTGIINKQNEPGQWESWECDWLLGVKQACPQLTQELWP